MVTCGLFGSLGAASLAWSQVRTSAALTLFETVLPVHPRAEQLCRMHIAAFHLWCRF